MSNQLTPLGFVQIARRRRAAANRLYEALVEGRLGHRYSPGRRVEFSGAVKGKRPVMAADLALVPPLVTQLVDVWADLGDELTLALGERSAPTDDEGHSGPAALVRGATRALARLRRAIREALLWDETLPANLESHVLGIMDQLSTPTRRTRDPEPVAEPAPAPAPGPVPIEVAVGPIEPEVAVG